MTVSKRVVRADRRREKRAEALKQRRLVALENLRTAKYVNSKSKRKSTATEEEWAKLRSINIAHLEELTR